MKHSQIAAAGHPDRMLKADEVFAMTGISRTQVYRLIRAGKFPRPFKVGTGSRWLESEVRAWKNALPRMTRPGDEPPPRKPPKPRTRDGIRAAAY